MNVSPINRILNAFERLHIDWRQGQMFRSGIEAAENSRRARFIEEPDVTTSFMILKELIPFGDMPRAELLRDLLLEREPVDREVNVSDVSAVLATKGGYFGNLDRLRHTIHQPECFTGEPFHAERDLLLEEVLSNAGSGGRLPIVREGWSGRLILNNKGGARRFAWLRHYGLDRTLPARITQYDLNPSVVRALSQEYWAFLIPCAVSAAVLEKLKIGGIGPTTYWPQQVFQVNANPCPPADVSVGWCGIVCERAHPAYELLRSALKSAPFEVFDFSRWIHLLAQGRLQP